MHTTVKIRVWVEINYRDFKYLRSIYAVMKFGMFRGEQKDTESAGFVNPHGNSLMDLSSSLRAWNNISKPSVMIHLDCPP